MQSSKFYSIYTDGSFLPKSHKGSWAFVVLAGSEPAFEKSGINKKTTSNRMEFQAAIEALKCLPLGADAIIHSDSRNLIDTMTLWLAGFKKNEWKKKSGRPIPDADLIQELEVHVSGKTITWKWVKGHSGNTLNERCDELCTQALRAA